MTWPPHTVTFLVVVVGVMTVLAGASWIADRARHRCPWCAHEPFTDADALAAHVRRCHRE